MWHWKLFTMVGLCVVVATVASAQQDAWNQLHQEAVKLCREGKYAEAIKIVEKSLEMAENTFGPDHSNLATSLNYLAELYRWQGRNSDAEPLYKRSLLITEKTLGPDHPDVAAALNNLAEVYMSEGKYAEAELLYKRSLPILVKALGADHPLVASSLSNFNQCKQMEKKKEVSECEECPQRIEPQKQNR